MEKRPTGIDRVIPSNTVLLEKTIQTVLGLPKENEFSLFEGGVASCYVFCASYISKEGKVCRYSEHSFPGNGIGNFLPEGSILLDYTFIPGAANTTISQQENDYRDFLNKKGVAPYLKGSLHKVIEGEAKEKFVIGDLSTEFKPDFRIIKSY